MTRGARIAIAMCALLATAKALADDDIAAGREIYATTCFICHFGIEDETSDADLLRVPAMMATWGPKLNGIIGRPAGAAEDFAYSQEFLETTAGMVWTEENLDRYITDSQAMVPRGLMFFAEPDPVRRHQIMRYIVAFN